MGDTLSEEKLFGRVAVITGAGGELGQALANAFFLCGTRLALLDIGPGLRQARALSRRLGTRALALPTDITREEQVRRAFAQVSRRWKRIDFLINNAALEGPTAPVERIRRQDWERTLAANLTGAFLCAREAARWFKRKPRIGGGCMIQVGSVAGRIAYPLRLPYAVSKSALEALTRTLAAELGPRNIRVNLVSPGPIAGRRMERVVRRRARASGKSERLILDRYLSASALRRMVTYEDVARLVLFLCSEEAKNITGQTLEVSAGWTAGSL